MGQAWPKHVCKDWLRSYCSQALPDEWSTRRYRTPASASHAPDMRSGRSWLHGPDFPARAFHIPLGTVNKYKMTEPPTGKNAFPFIADQFHIVFKSISCHSHSSKHSCHNQDACRTPRLCPRRSGCCRTSPSRYRLR